MHRVATLIVMIFAFAALAGVTTAHAHRYVSTPIVVLNHVDAHNQPIPVVVQVQRGQIDLGAGIVMPCGPHHAIPVTPEALMPVRPQQTPGTWQQTAIPLWPEPVPLRPPKSA